MTVKRIVVNIETKNIAKAHAFYVEILGLTILMDQGWISTYGNESSMPIQISFATEGGSGTAVPDLSIEVSDVDSLYVKMKASGFHIEYGPVKEPWGVYRFYVRDPFGKLINILAHQ